MQPGPIGPRGQGAAAAAAASESTGARAQTSVAAASAAGPIQVDLATLAPDTTEQSRTNLVDAMLAGRASDATQKTLARAETAAAARRADARIARISAR